MLPQGLGGEMAAFLFNETIGRLHAKLDRDANLDRRGILPKWQNLLSCATVLQSDEATAMAERTADVQAHWTTPGVLARIDAALTELGHDPQNLNPEILATIEHLHSGGLTRTAGFWMLAVASAGRRGTSRIRMAVASTAST